jgi:predicted metal-dependent enzyme (double-stranded beta helix superfamily)
MSKLSAAQREAAVEAEVARIREIAAKSGPDRAALAQVLEALKRLAARRDLWNEVDYPPPEAGERQARYLIREDADRGYALYLNVMRRGKRTPIHNHTTWACIAAVEGAEHNTLYRRLDDGATPGHAEVVEDGVVLVRAGGGIALMPDDIHAVEIRDDEIIRHLHLYGRALETLSERVAYDPASGTYSKMEIGVTSRHAGNAGAARQ